MYRQIWTSIRNLYGSAYLEAFRRFGPTIERWAAKPITVSREAWADAKYVSRRSLLPVVNTMVLYESFHGRSMSCNPLAMFLHLLDNDDYADLEHVWSVSNFDVIPSEFARHPKVRFIKTHSDDYRTALASAKYLINNSTFPAYFVRRNEQIYVNTWHGVPLKKMFKHESKPDLTIHKNSQRNFLQATHLLMPNAYTAEKLLGSSDLAGALDQKLHIIGSPRLDHTLDGDATSVRKSLGLGTIERVVLIAPTWRGTLKDVEVDLASIDGLVEELTKHLSPEYKIFVRLHNFLEKHINKNDLKYNVVPPEVDTNQCLSCVDVLVTDYSSIMFDFLPTGRKLILYTPDKERYAKERGLYVSLDEIPASICVTPREVIDAIRAPGQTTSDARFPGARNTFFPNEDGSATQRALTLIFDTPTYPRAPAENGRRKRILIFGGGWKNNGITSSLLNLLTQIDQSRYDVFVITNGEDFQKEPQRAENLRRIPEGVRLIHRCGRMSLSTSEFFALSAFYNANRFSDSAHEDRLKEIFRREFERLFGDMQFDVAIDFSGYSRYWTMLMGAANAPRRVLYMHNDMLSEANMRFHVLFGVFAVCPWLTTLASVSRETGELNRQNLVDRFGLEPKTMTHVPNAIVPDAILSGARQKPESDDWRYRSIISHKGPKFVTVGRLSPEKAQDRAIVALSRLVRRGVDAALYIIGEGRSEKALRKCAKANGVAERVHFLGQVDNPFIYLAQCDCFVLPSKYEGQPMVLLEAIVLGMPVIATDIAGSRSVIAGHGLLVPESVDGLVDGMTTFVNGGLPAPGFDADGYVTQSMRTFYSEVCGDTAPAPAPASARPEPMQYREHAN